MIAHTITLLMLSASVCLSQAVNYKVSTAGKDRAQLERVFQAVAAKEKPAEEAPLSFEVTLKISATEYLVWRRVQKRGELQTNYDQCFFLQLTEPLERADGEMIEEIHAKETAATKKIGVGTYRIVEQVKPEEVAAYTKEQFVADLKAGRTWTLINFAFIPCHRCLGDGKLGKLDKEAECPDCKGDGGKRADVIVGW